MEEQSISDLLVFRTMKATVAALLAAGKDPVEIVVSLNALAIELVSGQLQPSPQQ